MTTIKTVNGATIEVVEDSHVFYNNQEMGIIEYKDWEELSKQQQEEAKKMVASIEGLILGLTLGNLRNLKV